jgi:hypothetical protein
MKVIGTSSLSEYLGDRVVYRNLAPYDSKLPSLEAIRDAIGLPAGKIPRKSEPEYGQVVARFLKAAKELDTPGVPIKRIVYIGDTQMLDGTAFANICRAGNWGGSAFIASETDAPPTHEVIAKDDNSKLYLANRWQMLPDFEAFCEREHFQIDAETAVVIDMDKTMVGARGRNAHVIDGVRVEAVEQTVAGLLGDDFDTRSFRQAYQTFNQVAFHTFTADNQDYLAYICLILGSGIYDLDSVVKQVRDGELVQFLDFINQVDRDKNALDANLLQIHDEIFMNVQQGDPTPFKEFRRREYLVTVSYMGKFSESESVDKLLADEIVITGEVREHALKWLAQGALIFGVSDKPDEASIPTQAQAAQGYQPIHRTQTHIVSA